MGGLDAVKTVPDALGGFAGEGALGGVDVVKTVPDALGRITGGGEALGGADVVKGAADVNGGKVEDDTLGGVDVVKTVPDVVGGAVEEDECNRVAPHVSDEEARLFVDTHNAFRKNREAHPASDMVALVGFELCKNNGWSYRKGDLRQVSGIDHSEHH